MKSTNGSQNETVHSALKSLRTVSIEPSPFLAARVQANLQATRTQETSFSWLKLLSGLAAAGCFAAVVATIALGHGSGDGASYALNQPYMIKVDVRALSPQEVAYAEVEITGDAAAFNSKAFHNLDDAKKFTVAGEVLRNKQYLPVVVRGVKSGKSAVLVSFYNVQHQLISSRTVDLSFSEGT